MGLVDAARYPHRFYRWVLFDAAGEFGELTRLAEGGLRFEFRGLPGRRYVLQGSADLARWTDLEANVAASSTVSLTNRLDLMFPRRFFRLESD